MPSSYTASLRFELQGVGENLNTWGVRLSSALSRIDKAIAGLTTIALTADYALTSSNGDDEARSALLKFTGAGPWTVTIPSVSKSYLIWNACTAAVTITTGAGTTVAIDAGAKVKILCDGTNVSELGFAGLGLKAYIDAAALTATGSLPATTGNDGKVLACVAGAWTPTTLTLSYISDYAGIATAAEVRTGTNNTKTVTPLALSDAAAPITLADAATIAWDMATGFNAIVTLGGNRTLGAPTNARAGLSGALQVIQDGTGSRTLAYNAAWDFGATGAPTLTTTAAADDMIYWYCVATSPLKIKATFLAAA